MTFRFKGEDPTEKPTGSQQSLENKTGTIVPGIGEKNLDADSDLQSDSSDGEETVGERVPERRGEEKAPGSDDGNLRGCQSKQKQRDSRSPSEERPPRSPPPEKPDRRRDEAHQRDERSSQRRHGKDERSHHRRREDRHRRKDWEEEEEEEEKREQRRGRDKKEHRAREKDRDGDREKGRGRDTDLDEHARKRSSESVAQGDPQTQEGNLPSPEKSSEVTDKPSEDSKEAPEKPAEKLNKFAKRSNQETVSSARDRYLSRQMARVGPKPYVEKEED